METILCQNETIPEPSKIVDEKTENVNNNSIKNIEIESTRTNENNTVLTKQQQYNKEWYQRNKESRKIKNREWYAANKEKHNNLTKEYYKEHKNTILSRNVKRYNDNTEHCLKICKQYRQNNKDQVNAVVKKCYLKKKEHYDHKRKLWRQNNKSHINIVAKNRLKYNVNARISNSLRARFRAALKGNYKVGSAVRDLGCSIDELKTRLESKFINGMTWTNYGEWHIDHIKPLSKFDLTNREQLLEACHYSNLQPLWAFDNLSKGNKLI